MKKPFFVLVLSLLTLPCFSQKLQGKYNGHHPDLYFFFDKGMAEFSFKSEGGVTVPLRGAGKFNISSDYLLITTVNFYGFNKKYYSKVKYEKIIEDSRILIFKIVSIEKNKISLMFLDKGLQSAVFTDKVLRNLEKKAKQDYHQIQVFKK